MLIFQLKSRGDLGRRDRQASLDSLPRLDAGDPRPDVRELVEWDTGARGDAHPGEGLDICEPIGIDEILAVREARLEDAVQTLRLVQVPVDCVRAVNVASV